MFKIKKKLIDVSTQPVPNDDNRWLHFEIERHRFSLTMALIGHTLTVNYKAIGLC